MSAHLTLPYNWENCTEPENCQEYIHLQDTAENLNNYPVEWIEEFIGNCTILIKKDDTGSTVTETIKFYDTNGEPHSRTNQPAVIQHQNPDPGKLNHSQKEWYQHGTRHREDGPAIECSDGRKMWLHHGDFHREDGPAREWANKGEEWYKHGELHREDGPAVIDNNGGKRWYQHGTRHRENGPAVVHADSTKEWWLNGIQFPNPPYA